MVDKTIQVMQAENNSSERNLHEKASTESASSSKEGSAKITPQKCFKWRVKW